MSKTCRCGKLSLPDRTLCRECRNARNRRRYAKDGGYRKALQSKAKTRYNPEARKAAYHDARRRAFQVLGGYVCSECGFDDPRALQIDHVNDDGYRRRRNEGELGEALYRRVIKAGGEGFQVLCANCNWVKKAESEGRTVEYYWDDPRRAFPVRPPGRPTNAQPSEAYPAFHTGEPMGKVAKRLRVSNATLRRWWLDQFGEQAVVDRGRSVQRKAASETGLANKGKSNAERR